MDDFVERMRGELAELKERTEKLGTFIAGDTYAGLDLALRALMAEQHVAMEQYRDALQKRLDLETGETDGDRAAAS